MSISLEQLGTKFIGRRQELRRLKEDFFTRGIRAVVLHGIGGIGKTVTAAKIAERLEKYFSFIYSIVCRKGLTIEEVLIQLNEFLKRNGIDELENTVKSDALIDVKVNYLAQVLSQVKLLLIFDNFESLLSEEQKRWEIKDKNLKEELKALVSQCQEETRFLFTSRYTFNLTDGRLTNELDEINLNELSQIEAFMMMNPFPELAKQSFQTKLAIYEKTGGQPYTINVFGNLARKKSIQDILTDISDVTKEMVEFTLLNTMYESLTEDTRSLLNRASIFRKSVPYSGLEWVMKDNGEIPDIQEFVKELIHWGLLVKIDEDSESYYQIHTIVKDFIGTKTGAQERKNWLITGAEYYENLVKSTKSVWDYLDGRELYFEAGEYDKAGDIVANVMEYLHRWGFIDLVRKLNEETIITSSGLVKARALHNLGMIHYYLGEYDKAIEKYMESLKITKELADKGNIAVTLHALGMIHQHKGEYDKAIENYTESINIAEALGDKGGIAKTLGQLGTLHYSKGNYNSAIKIYNDVIKTFEELKNQVGIATTLLNLGMINQAQGEYDEAMEKYTESLKIAEALGDRNQIAISLGQLGNIHFQKGEYEKAIEKYKDSLKINEALGDKGGIAGTMHQMGNIHYQQGEYDKAIRKYTESLNIAETLGDKSQIANSLGQLGQVYQIQKNFKGALKNYIIAYSIFNQLKSPYEKIAERFISQIKDKIGEKTFKKYYEEIMKELQG